MSGTAFRRPRTPIARRLRIVCHQMGVVAPASRKVTEASEGIHKDGSDYIVAVLVAERRGIEGGESVVYRQDKRTEPSRPTLHAGILQADARSLLWHWVTPVHPSDPHAVKGDRVRSIPGYDVHVG